jgi:hypothetical protein
MINASASLGELYMASLTCSWRTDRAVLGAPYPCGNLQPIICKNHVAAQTFGPLRQVWRAWTCSCMEPDPQTPMIAWKRSSEPNPRATESLGVSSAGRSGATDWHQEKPLWLSCAMRSWKCFVGVLQMGNPNCHDVLTRTRCAH